MRITFRSDKLIRQLAVLFMAIINVDPIALRLGLSSGLRSCLFCFSMEYYSLYVDFYLVLYISLILSYDFIFVNTFLNI